MPINHIGIQVPSSVFEQTIDFYKTALAPLGYTTFVRPNDRVIGLGVSNVFDFWIASREKNGDDDDERECGPGQDRVTPVHVAFQAESRDIVDAFHAAGLKAGGTSNGLPGLRKQYAPEYYAAYVEDPMRNNVEVMCVGGRNMIPNENFEKGKMTTNAK